MGAQSAISRPREEFTDLLENAVRAHLIAMFQWDCFFPRFWIRARLRRLRGGTAGICSFRLSFPGTAYDEHRLRASIANIVERGIAIYRWGGEAGGCPGSTKRLRLDAAQHGWDQYVPWFRGRERSWAQVRFQDLAAMKLFGVCDIRGHADGLRRLIRMAWFVPAPLRRAIAPLLRA